jgi:hypothetical protein
MSNLPQNLKQEAGKSGLSALAFALRNKSMWPEGFVWNFSYVYSCAMGLSVELGLVKLNRYAVSDFDFYFSSVKETFDIDYYSASAIFCHSGFELPTPEIIADRIDKYLENKNYYINCRETPTVNYPSTFLPAMLGNSYYPCIYPDLDLIYTPNNNRVLEPELTLVE